MSGERPIQRELEAALADLHGVEDCVVFVSGHATNVTLIVNGFGITSSAPNIFAWDR